MTHITSKKESETLLFSVENCFGRLELQRKESQKDRFGEITSVTSNNGLQPIVVEEYTYDANGNRLTAIGGVTATYDAQDRMLTYGDNSYTYTVNGSLLTKTNAEGVTKYSYDAMGNLLKVVLPDNRVITYQIDARGRRIGKKIDGVFAYGFVYSDQLNPIAKVDENGVILEQYIYGLKSNVPEYVVKNGVKCKIISDHLGSPMMIIKISDNSIMKEIKYDSFGNILLDSAPNFEIPFRFAGGIWDKDTKLVRFGVRDYDSETGRWTSKEPLGFDGSRNFYVYAGNDGVNWIDLDGRNPFLNPQNWIKFYEIIESYWNKLDPLIKWLIGGIAFDYLKEEFTVDNIINSCHQISNAINNLLMSPIQIFVIFPATYGKLNYGLRYSNKNFPPIRLDSKPRRLPYE